MAKTDLIRVYTGGTKDAFSPNSPFAGHDGIWMVTHDIDYAMATLSTVCTQGNLNHITKGVGTHFIKVELRPVWDYIHENQENLSMEECQKLAKEHAFELEPGWFPGR